jgi:hypothetical protein
MKLMTKEIIEKFAKQTPGSENNKPILKLFGGSSCTWLLSEYDPEERMFFGLCDLGMGYPELGYVSYDELLAVKFPPFGLPVERDKYFDPDKTLIEYAVEATKKGRIV